MVKLKKVRGRKFEMWILKAKYSNGYKSYIWESEESVNSRYIIKGHLTVAVNGRNTAYVKFEKLWIHYSNLHFGYRLSRHFAGHNASHQARAWFRYLLKRSPDYVDLINESKL